MIVIGLGLGHKDHQTLCFHRRSRLPKSNPRNLRQHRADAEAETRRGADFEPTRAALCAREGRSLGKCLPRVFRGCRHVFARCSGPTSMCSAAPPEGRPKYAPAPSSRRAPPARLHRDRQRGTARLTRWSWFGGNPAVPDRSKLTEPLSWKVRSGGSSLRTVTSYVLGRSHRPAIQLLAER